MRERGAQEKEERRFNRSDPSFVPAVLEEGAGSIVVDCRDLTPNPAFSGPRCHVVNKKSNFLCECHSPADSGYHERLVGFRCEISGALLRTSRVYRVKVPEYN